jgi:hypothetical protein
MFSIGAKIMQEAKFSLKMASKLKNLQYKENWKEHSAL